MHLSRFHNLTMRWVLIHWYYCCCYYFSVAYLLPIGSTEVLFIINLISAICTTGTGTLRFNQAKAVRTQQCKLQSPSKSAQRPGG